MQVCSYVRGTYAVFLTGREEYFEHELESRSVWPSVGLGLHLFIKKNQYRTGQHNPSEGRPYIEMPEEGLAHHDGPHRPQEEQLKERRVMVELELEHLYQLWHVLN